MQRVFGRERGGERETEFAVSSRDIDDDVAADWASGRLTITASDGPEAACRDGVTSDVAEKFKFLADHLCEDIS